MLTCRVEEESLLASCNNVNGAPKPLMVLFSVIHDTHDDLKNLVSRTTEWFIFLHIRYRDNEVVHLAERSHNHSGRRFDNAGFMHSPVDCSEVYHSPMDPLFEDSLCWGIRCTSFRGVTVTSLQQPRNRHLVLSQHELQKNNAI